MDIEVVIGMAEQSERDHRRLGEGFRSAGSESRASYEHGAADALRDFALELRAHLERGSNGDQGET